VTRLVSVAALGLVLALAAVGCGGSSGTADRPTVEVFGPYRGVEADRFADVLATFEQKTGIRVRYVGSVDFVDDLERRAGEDNDPPDLAVVPQPGLIRRLVADGAVVRPSSAVAAAVESSTLPSAAALGRIDGALYAVPFRISLKSLVWYRPAVFAEHGWHAPTTLAELRTLVARIASDGHMAPWCLGLSAGTATGWPATDWVEDLLLRTAGPTVYRGWVQGTVPFSDPRVARAFAAFHDLVLARGAVAGGLSAVVATPVAEAVRPLFAVPPGCAMLKQGDFATAWMPGGTTIGNDGDVDWFLLPGETVGRAPILVGGDQIVQLRRSSEADALMEYLAGPDAGVTWAREGGFLSPKSTIPLDAYPPGYLRELSETARRATVLAFDGSDQMPPDIGSGLFWQEITRWVAGVEAYTELAAHLDTARASEVDAASG
jgi:alpha-glucoside transport system substrate-binding protein